MNNQKVIKIKHAVSSALPPSTTPKAKWGNRFGSHTGVAIKLSKIHTATVFLDERLNSGDYNQVLEIFGRESVGAYVISCEGKEWTVKFEPTGVDRCGIIVYTEGGKALMSGTAMANKGGGWKGALKSLYPGIRNAKGHKVGVGVKVPTNNPKATEVTVTGEISF